MLPAAKSKDIKYQSELFKNRLAKRSRHLKKWAQRNGIYAYRLYDKDIPEIPLAVDVYFPCGENKVQTGEAFINMALYKRPYEAEYEEEMKWLNGMAKAAGEVMKIPDEHIFVKIRERQKGKSQYEKLSMQKRTFTINEGGSIFLVNISDYLDTGIFLDHRPLRLQIAKETSGKKVLNLFCYTGTFSVHAMKGNAYSVDSVDLSKTYLDWAEKNMKLNNINPVKTFFHRSDVKEFLKKKNAEKALWDTIICDPPTFSNSKRTAGFFDINKDWKELCILCLGVLNKNGVLYFSSNSAKLKFDGNALEGLYNEKLKVTDLTNGSIPEDFCNKKIHRLWSISKDITGQSL